MVFHWSLSDSKFSKVSRTLLLVDLNNAVIWMVSIRPPVPLLLLLLLSLLLLSISFISKSSSPFINPLVAIPIVIGINVTFIFQFFQFLSKVEVLLLLLLQVFLNTSVSRRCFTGVWVAANFLGSPGLFSVFGPILATLLSKWSRFFLGITTLPVSFWSLWELFQAYQL